MQQRPRGQAFHRGNFNGDFYPNFGCWAPKANSPSVINKMPGKSLQPIGFFKAHVGVR